MVCLRLCACMRFCECMHVHVCLFLMVVPAFTSSVHPQSFILWEGVVSAFPDAWKPAFDCCLLDLCGSRILPSVAHGHSWVSLTHTGNPPPIEILDEDDVRFLHRMVQEQISKNEIMNVSLRDLSQTLYPHQQTVHAL